MRKRESIQPEGAPSLTETYTDWRDFTNRVCRPLVERDGENPKADAWYYSLVIAQDPYYLAVSLVMAENALRQYEETAQ